MKKALKIASLLLAVLTVAGLFASCGDTNGDTEVETTAAAVATGAEETTSMYDADGYLLDDLPTLNYGGQTVSILYWDDAERPEFEITEEEVNGAIVEQAIFDRNKKTEERLGVSFEWEGTPGDNGDRANFVAYVANQYSGGNTYDIIATYTRTSGMLSTRGYLMNVNKIDGSYLDFDKPWWPDTMLETCSIADRLYFFSGDISTNVLHFMYAIYYNMELCQSLNLEDPVKYVDDHTWTIAKLQEMTSNLYIDLDNSGSMTSDDQYGFCSCDYHLDAFYTGSGLRLVEADTEKTLVISPDFTSDKCMNLVDTLGAWLVKQDCYVDGGKAGDVSYALPFVNGNALFCQNRVYMADNKSSSGLNAVEWKYGILPTPLYDTDQENYITVVGNPFTLWSIGAGTSEENAKRDTAVIECMASYGYRLTTPALFETNMKYRYTSDEKGDSVRMFDIIHNTIAFDLGRIYSDTLNYMSEMPSKMAANGTSWASQAKIQNKTLTKTIASKIVDAILALD